jgi:hypothetical protein
LLAASLTWATIVAVVDPSGAGSAGLSIDSEMSATVPLPEVAPEPPAPAPRAAARRQRRHGQRRAGDQQQSPAEALDSFQHRS